MSPRRPSMFQSPHASRRSPRSPYFAAKASSVIAGSFAPAWDYCGLGADDVEHRGFGQAELLGDHPHAVAVFAQLANLRAVHNRFGPAQRLALLAGSMQARH